MKERIVYMAEIKNEQEIPTYRLPFNSSIRYSLINTTGKETKFPQTKSWSLPAQSNISSVQSGVVTTSKLSLEDCIEGQEEEAHLTNMVYIQGDDGYIQIYIHVNPIVQVGDRITENQQIGTLHGYCVKDEPHLHFIAGKFKNHTFEAAQIKIIGEQ